MFDPMLPYGPCSGTMVQWLYNVNYCRVAAFYNNRGDGHSVGDIPMVSILIALAVVLLWLSPLYEMWTPKPRNECSCCSCPKPEEDQAAAEIETSEATAAEARRPVVKTIKPHSS